MKDIIGHRAGAGPAPARCSSSTSIPMNVYAMIGSRYCINIGAAQTGPPTSLFNEWPRRRALSTAKVESSKPFALQIPQLETSVIREKQLIHLNSFLHEKKTPRCTILGQAQVGLVLPGNNSVLDGTKDQPLLRLLAAWDSLAARLPPGTGDGSDGDLLVASLKLVLSRAPPETASRALLLALRLAEVAGSVSRRLPLDSTSIAAGILAEAFPSMATGPSPVEIEGRLGPHVATLLGDLRKVLALPARIDVYDDVMAAGIRQLCLGLYDVRATAVGVVLRLHALALAWKVDGNAGGESLDASIAAMEALQIYAPMGHALGLGAVATELEDLSLRVLFPSSYEATSQWLLQEAAANQATLEGCSDRLKIAVQSDPGFKRLAAGLEVVGRTKSPYSTLKKLLRLGETARGGRSRDELHDIIGLRAIVIPHPHLSIDEAEQMARKACYKVETVAHALWPPVSGRNKDYIAAPKPNGYQSLHSTVVLDSSSLSTEGSSRRQAVQTLELQIRTQGMHAFAESGDAAHAAYKGGLDASQVKQMREWAESLLRFSRAADRQAIPTGDLNNEPSLPSSAAEALFRSFDTDGDGRVSLDELKHAVVELGGVRAEDPTQNARTLLVAADTNNDGEVSLEEFLEFQKWVGIIHRASVMDDTASSKLMELQPHHSSDVDKTSHFVKSVEWRPAKPEIWVRPTPFSSLRPENCSSLHVWGALKNHGSRPISVPHSVSRDGSASASVSSSSIDEAISPNRPRMLTPFQGYPDEDGADEKIVEDVDAEDAMRSSEPPPFLAEAPHHLHTDNEAEDVLLRMKPDVEEARRVHRPMHEISRMFRQAGVFDINARWELVPMASLQGTDMLDASGRPIEFSQKDALSIPLPRHGPCIVGAVRDRDCDLVLDIPTVSGRHARLEVIRRRSVGLSKCVIMDLGSTNGTWINRTQIAPFKEVSLYPGDIVCLAEAGIAFEVRTASEPGPETQRVENSSHVKGMGRSVTAALRIAAALEAEAASRGVFAPPEARCFPLSAADLGARARDLLAAQEYQAAYMLLLGGAMAHPEDAGLWAQLAGMERHRARRRVQGSSTGTSRAFLRAAVERFEVDSDDGRRREGLSRVFNTWAQLEYDQRNDGPARILFQKAVRAAKAHRDSKSLSTGVAKLLFTWAVKEMKLGDAPLATRLCREALEIESENPYVHTLLGTIAETAGALPTARQHFRDALKSNPGHVPALQAWARLEAADGNLRTARTLFKRALKLHPENVFVLQAFGVAEGRAGNLDVARRLLQRCTTVDPGCRAGWHAWAKLEEAAGNLDYAREMYNKVLKLKPNSVETLSALGRLERVTGNIAMATTHLEAALKANPRHAPSLHELGQLLRVQGHDAEAYRLEKKAKRVNQDANASISHIRFDTSSFH